MASGGHGISDAVRKSIRDWMTTRVIDILHKELKRTTLTPMEIQALTWNLRSDGNWVRISRKRSDKAGVWSRTYYSKLFGKGHVGLTVLTNPARPGQTEDMFIEAVTITLAGKVIGGGRVSVPSVQLSQKGRQAAIQDFQTNSLFSEFTEVELARLTAEMEYGEDSVLALIEEERVA